MDSNAPFFVYISIQAILLKMPFKVCLSERIKIEQDERRCVIKLEKRILLFIFT
jgi:hypothetical protein